MNIVNCQLMNVLKTFTFNYSRNIYEDLGIVFDNEYKKLFVHIFSELTQ